MVGQVDSERRALSDISRFWTGNPT